MLKPPVKINARNLLATEVTKWSGVFCKQVYGNERVTAAAAAGECQGMM